jgi:hypothetical protein
MLPVSLDSFPAGSERAACTISSTLFRFWKSFLWDFDNGTVGHIIVLQVLTLPNYERGFP